MSFHLMMSVHCMSPSNRFAMASRWMRSPSFSRLLMAMMRSSRPLGFSRLSMHSLSNGVALAMTSAWRRACSVGSPTR